MEMDRRTEALYQIESKTGLYVGRLLPGHMEDWGVGAINAGREFDQDAERRFAQQALDSISPVAGAELSYSDCTDSRLRTTLADGSRVPNRQQTVGADLMTAFAVTEALGPRFYANPGAPVKERLNLTADFLVAYGLRPGTHTESCGGAAHFPAIVRNGIKFAEYSQYVERQQLLLPKGVFDPTISDEVIAGAQDRLDRDLYAGWSDNLVNEAVRRTTGDRGFVGLTDDGRGIRGHVEQLIVRADTPGAALDVNLLAEKTDGGQAFSINDDRLWRIARLFGRGDDKDYRIACMAIEDFTDAAHGTLGTGMSTLLISEAA
jgi:hypothetical protein